MDDKKKVLIINQYNGNIIIKDEENSSREIELFIPSGGEDLMAKIALEWLNKTH